MEQDKKVKDGEMTLILMRGLGEAFVASGVPRATIRTFLTNQLAG
jgi:3-dehydroquinate synthetase